MMARLRITARVCASTPSGSTPGASGLSGIWPVTNTNPPASTAWLNGATGLGPEAIMWNNRSPTMFIIHVLCDSLRR